ncbi:MAG TPA: hypothetical protein VM661_05785 [Candidatus Sulfotelmatobacter sp.]|jgi:hypothetical protein|nr:hypothetical protein [Candidatus Sulfotelmatobacter sp.]
MPSLVLRTAAGLRLPDEIHPMADLLQMDGEQVLAAFRGSQRKDFLELVGQVERPGSALFDLFDGMRRRVDADNPFHGLALFRPGALADLFVELHDHVLDHPVWRHPFFIRFFKGEFDRGQALAFAVQYFNQIKNTRQCVAMAVGRFHGLMPLPFGSLNEKVSELTQITLAQLVADEYGVGSHELANYPALGRLLNARTHIGMYRQLFEGFGVAENDQDRPMLAGVADNVLTQRLLAGDPRFSPLEALASVGLGMEWGVPEFFSLLLGGLIRFSERTGAGLTAHQLDVFIAHVRYDVLHAVSVMLATSLHMRGQQDLAVVKDACNALMAARYAMMSDVYRHVFGEDCVDLAGFGLDDRHRLGDRRIADALIEARAKADPARLAEGEAYACRRDLPFLFKA